MQQKRSAFQSSLAISEVWTLSTVTREGSLLNLELPKVLQKYYSEQKKSHYQFEIAQKFSDESNEVGVSYAPLSIF